MVLVYLVRTVFFFNIMFKICSASELVRHWDVIILVFEFVQGPITLSIFVQQIADVQLIIILYRYFQDSNSF